MNRGIYTATIALTALVLAVAIIASTEQRLALQEENIYGKAVIEVKSHWQNARYVLDKAASDAIADGILANGCGYSEDDVKAAMRGYFTAALGKMWQNECVLDGFALTGPSDNIQISATITCTKYFSEQFNTSYEKGAIFEKAVSGNNSAGGCLVDVKDLQSGICEVDGIPSGNPDDLCSA